MALPKIRSIDSILESPQLTAAVRKLEAPVLRHLIDHIGLEDAGELVVRRDGPVVGGHVAIMHARLEARGPGDDGPPQPPAAGR